MKKLQVIAILIAAVIGAGAIFQNSFAQEKPQPQATKVAVCDVVMVFKNYQKAKDLTEKLKNRLDEIKAESDKRNKAIERIKMDMDQLKAGSKEYDDRLNEMTKLTIERDAWLTFQDDLAKRENFRLTKEMYDEILKIIEHVSKDRGFDLVLFKESNDLQSRNLDELLQQMARRKVLYSSQTLDLTEEVLIRLNQEYKAGQK